jgi:hypothetical protein
MRLSLRHLLSELGVEIPWYGSPSRVVINGIELQIYLPLSDPIEAVHVLDGECERQDDEQSNARTQQAHGVLLLNHGLRLLACYLSEETQHGSLIS